MQIRSLDPPRISLKLFVKGVGLHSNANLLNIYTAQNKLHLSGLFSSLIIIAVGPIWIHEVFNYMLNLAMGPMSIEVKFGIIQWK